jgi:UTP--glucose-1-phosphate uridylyltransferase
MKIIKAVIPAAGHGTRFLPWTKAVPKEMLPLLNKPAIQYIVEEIAQSGMNNCIMITSPHKYAIANHFDNAPALEQFLQKKNKSYLLDNLNTLSASVEFSYIHQEEAKGLGHAVWLAHNAIAQEYFSVLLPDDIMVSAQPAIKQLADIAQKENASVIAVQEVPQENVSAYGVIAIKKQLASDLYEVSDLIEKPALQNAPSNLAIIGRYILSHKIFKALDEVKPSAGGEIQLTDGIARMLKNGERVLAYKIHGIRYDVGTPQGWLHAIMHLAQTV